MTSLSFMVRVAMACPDEYQGHRDLFPDTINELHQARLIEEQEIEFVGDLNPDDVRRYFECHFSQNERDSTSAEYHHLCEIFSTNQREIVDDFSTTAEQYDSML
jgi:hypothetical protein